MSAVHTRQRSAVGRPHLLAVISASLVASCQPGRQRPAQVMATLRSAAVVTLRMAGFTCTAQGGRWAETVTPPGPSQPLVTQCENDQSPASDPAHGVLILTTDCYFIALRPFLEGHDVLEHGQKSPPSWPAHPPRTEGGGWRRRAPASSVCGAPPPAKSPPACRQGHPQAKSTCWCIAIGTAEEQQPGTPALVVMSPRQIQHSKVAKSYQHAGHQQAAALLDGEIVLVGVASNHHLSHGDLTTPHHIITSSSSS